MDVKIPYLVAKPGRRQPNGTRQVRYFWQPSAAGRARGWPSMRLSDVEAEAIDQARKRNAEFAAARASGEGTTLDVRAGASGRRRNVRPGSVADMIGQYKASRFYRVLAPKTQQGYDQWLAVIDEWAGDAAARAITPRMVQQLYEPMQEKTPAKANAVIRVLRILMKFGLRNDMIGSNPAAEPGLIGLERSGLLWPREAVALFVDAADKMGRHSVGTAVMLNEWIGQRQGDVLRLRRERIDFFGRMKVRQSKTGARVALPIGIVDALTDRLEVEAARQAARDRELGRKVISTALIRSEETGEAYKGDNFRHLFAEIRAKAAEIWPRFPNDAIGVSAGAGAEDDEISMLDLQFMHLRHTAVTRLAEAGVDMLGIAAITGHSPKTVSTILDIYTIRTGAMAEEGFRKRAEFEGRRIGKFKADLTDRRDEG